eukprot:ANDGO_03889.mRNA.1 hypothetical protein
MSGRKRASRSETALGSSNDVAARESSPVKKPKLAESANNGSVSLYYHRKNCATCGKSDDFLAKTGVIIPESSRRDATKNRVSPAEALEIVQHSACGQVLVAGRAGAVQTLVPNADGRWDGTALKSTVVGPSGFLRAPTIIKDKTMIVGFSSDAYKTMFA